MAAHCGHLRRQRLLPPIGGEGTPGAWDTDPAGFCPPPPATLGWLEPRPVGPHLPRRAAGFGPRPHRPWRELAHAGLLPPHALYLPWVWQLISHAGRWREASQAAAEAGESLALSPNGP